MINTEERAKILMKIKKIERLLEVKEMGVA